MGSVVVYNPRNSTSSRVGSGGDGGDVDDFLRRLGNVEVAVTDLRSQVDVIAATIPHLATAASVADIKAILPHLATEASVAEIRSTMPHLATKAELLAVKEELKGDVLAVRADLSAMEAKIIKWIIATVLTSTSLAFTIARFVH